MRGILTKKVTLNTHFDLFCLLFSPVRISLIWLQQWSDNIFSTAPRFILGIILMRLSLFHQKRLPWFQETKNPNGNAENEISMTRNIP